MQSVPTGVGARGWGMGITLCQTTSNFNTPTMNPDEKGAVHVPKVCRNKLPYWNRAPWNSNQSVAILILLLLSDLTSSCIFDKKATENEKQSVACSYFASLVKNWQSSSLSKDMYQPTRTCQVYVNMRQITHLKPYTVGLGDITWFQQKYQHIIS